MTQRNKLIIIPPTDIAYVRRTVQESYIEFGDRFQVSGSSIKRWEQRGVACELYSKRWRDLIDAMDQALKQFDFER